MGHWKNNLYNITLLLEGIILMGGARREVS